MYFLGRFKFIRNTKWWQKWFKRRNELFYRELKECSEMTPEEETKRKLKRMYRIWRVTVTLGILAVACSIASVLIQLMKQ